jgi:hypothetical protein
MKRRGLQLSRRHRRALGVAGGLLLVTGAAWAWVDHLDATAQANDTLRDLKPWLLKVHGFSAMTFVFLLGTLVPGHMRRGWHMRKNHQNGAFFLAAVSVLTLSGYLLYYLGDEHWRNATSSFHLWLGLVVPALLVWHIWSGRKATRS